MRYNATKLCFTSTAILALLVTGCKQTSKDGYDTDSVTGVQYHFFTHSDNGAKPQLGDVAELMLTMKNSKDSVIFNSEHRPGKPDSIKTMHLHLKDSYKGCLAQGITMMAAGDSASFMISADSLYYKTFGSKTLPSYIQAGTMLTCNVKLIKFETQEQAKAEREKRMQMNEADMAKHKAEEANTIAKYISDNHVTAKPEADGMYILKDEKGKGKGIKEGDSVEVEFTAMLLDGTVAEQSNHGDQRTSYFISYKKEAQLKGIDDLLANMKEGEKVKALFPSSLAFDNQQQGPLIEPYTPLIFEIKVVKVKPGK